MYQKDHRLFQNHLINSSFGRETTSFTVYWDRSNPSFAYSYAAFTGIEKGKIKQKSTK